MKEERYSKLILADQHLRYIFSKYPRPIKIEACPCGCCPDPNAVLRGISSRYIGKAITTWGSEEDFKYFLPRILRFVYLEENDVASEFLVSKIKHVTTWEPEEFGAIQAWLLAYVDYKYVTDFETKILEMRELVFKGPKVFLANHDFMSPFHNLTWGDFKEMRCLFSDDQVEKLENLFLNKWPQDDVDALSFALGFNFSDIPDMKEVFSKEKIDIWLSSNKEKVEHCFWQSSDDDIQRICSDALEIIKIYT